VGSQVALGVVVIIGELVADIALLIGHLVGDAGAESQLMAQTNQDVSEMPGCELRVVSVSVSHPARGAQSAASGPFAAELAAPQS